MSTDNRTNNEVLCDEVERLESEWRIQTNCIANLHDEIADLEAENKRLRKCVSDEWDGVAADKILADVEHLRTINAELLAACKSVVRHEAMAFQNCQVAIKKAKGD